MNFLVHFDSLRNR